MLMYPAVLKLLPDQEYPAFEFLHGCGVGKMLLTRNGICMIGCTIVADNDVVNRGVLYFVRKAMYLIE